MIGNPSNLSKPERETCHSRSLERRDSGVRAQWKRTITFVMGYDRRRRYQSSDEVASKMRNFNQFIDTSHRHRTNFSHSVIAKLNKYRHSNHITSTFLLRLRLSALFSV